MLPTLYFLAKPGCHIVTRSHCATITYLLVMSYSRLGRKGLCGAKYNLGTRGIRCIRLISYVNAAASVRLKANEENVQCGFLGPPWWIP